MTSFTTSNIPKPLSPCKESTDNGFNVLEFHGGVAYDHESLPKIVAVHTLVHVGSEQTHVHDEDGTLTQADGKKNTIVKMPTAHERGNGYGRRRWIILSKPELPFSQITKVTIPEEGFQIQPRDQPFPKKRLFDFSNQKCYFRNLDFKSKKTTESNEYFNKKLSVTPNQVLDASCSDVKCTSRESKISDQLSETEKDEKISMESKTPGQIVDSVKVGKSFSLKEVGVPTKNLTTCSDATHTSLATKISGQSTETKKVGGKFEQQIMMSTNNPPYPTEDMRTTSCSEAKDTSSRTKASDQPSETIKVEESSQIKRDDIPSKDLVTFCSNPKRTSTAPKILKVGESLQKQRADASTEDSVASCFEPERTSITSLPKDIAEPVETLSPVLTLQSESNSATCGSTFERGTTSATMNKSEENASKKRKLSLKERITNRIQRLKDMESYKETPEATDLYQTITSCFEPERTSITSLPKDIAKPVETSPPALTRQSENKSATCGSTTSATRNKSEENASKKGKLSLKERMTNRIQRLKDMESYQETPEATDLYQKLSRFTKLGFGVASSLNILSKNGEIRQSQEDVENGQEKKTVLSEDLVKEMVLMEKLRKDRKALQAEFLTEQKKFHLKLNDVMRSKNRKKNSEGVHNETSGPIVQTAAQSSPSSEPDFILAVEDNDLSNHSSAKSSPETSVFLASNQNQEYCSKSLPEYLDKVRCELRTSGAGAEKTSLEMKQKDENQKDENQNEVYHTKTPEKMSSPNRCLAGKRTGDNSEKAALEKKQENENRNNVLYVKTPEKGKSLNQCLDKLGKIRATTISVKRTLEEDKEDGLQITNLDSLPKRPRKSAPRRLAMERGPSHDDDHTEYTIGVNEASSDDEDCSFTSSSPSSAGKGKTIAEINQSLYNDETLLGEIDSSSREELNVENMNQSAAHSALRGMKEPDSLSFIKLPDSVSDGVTSTLDVDTDGDLPPTCLFTEVTFNEQMDEAPWESSCLNSHVETVASNHPWKYTPYTTIPRENYTIETSLHREERIKALLAKQNQLLSKINSSLNGKSIV